MSSWAACGPQTNVSLTSCVGPRRPERSNIKPSIISSCWARFLNINKDICCSKFDPRNHFSSDVGCSFPACVSQRNVRRVQSELSVLETTRNSDRAFSIPSTNKVTMMERATFQFPALISGFDAACSCLLHWSSLDNHCNCMSHNQSH